MATVKVKRTPESKFLYKLTLGPKEAGVLRALTGMVTGDNKPGHLANGIWQQLHDAGVAKRYEIVGHEDKNLDATQALTLVDIV
jgi:hypothetical protein